MTPAEAAALTQRAEQAEGDAARFERDLTALHGDYDALAVERDGLRATLDAVAALVGGGDVVERVRELVAAEQRLDAVERAGYV